MFAARTDIHPLCDKHRNVHMAPVVVFAENIQLRWPMYACPEPDCQRFFNVWEGYFDFINDKPLFDRTKQIICPEDETTFYLETFERPGSVARWRCAYLHCNRTETVRDGSSAPMGEAEKAGKK